MMKSLTLSVLLLIATAVSMPAMAAGKSASFQATFTILESCAVESTAKQPVVRCQFATPSNVATQAVAAEAAAAPQQAAADAGTTQAQSKVWTVTF